MLHRRRHEQRILVEPVTAAVQTLTKPDYLLAAEQRLVGARADRDAKVRAHKSACQELANSPTVTNTIPASVRRLELEVEEAEGKVRKAREALALAREKFTPTFASTIQPSVDLAMEELSAISARAHVIAASLVEAQESAVRNGLTIGGPVARSVAIREAVHWLNRLVQGLCA